MGKSHRTSVVLTEDTVKELDKRGGNTSETVRTIIRRYAALTADGSAKVRAHFSADDLKQISKALRDCSFEHPETIQMFEQLTIIPLSDYQRVTISGLNFPERLALIDMVEMGSFK